MSIWVELWVNNTIIPSFAFGSVNRGMTYLRGTILKDYVLKIHRRGKNDRRTFVGEVEEVGVEGNKAFSNLDELWEILNSSEAETAKGMRHNKHNGLNKPNKLWKAHYENGCSEIFTISPPEEPKSPRGL